MLFKVRRLTTLPLTLVFALFLVLAACGHPSPPAFSIATFTPADSTHPLAVHPHQPFQVVLDDCGSDGGYLWTASMASPTLLSQVGDPARHFSSNLPGSPGTWTFRFLPLAGGSTTLVFNCARSWESLPPLHTVSFVFTIA